MNDLEYLRRFTPAEIANRTHLDRFTIKAIIDKDFEKLLNVNIKMNIKVLEREFDVKFDDWINEFNAYKEEHYKNNEDTFKVKPKVVGFESGKKEEKSGFSLFFIMILLLGITGGGAYYYFEYFDKGSFKESISLGVEPQKSVVIEQNSTDDNEIKKEETLKEVVKEAAKEEEKQEEKTKDKQEEKAAEEVKTEEKQEETAKEEEKQEEKIEDKQEEKAAEEVKTEEKQETQDVKEGESAEKAVKSEHKLYLNPKKKCWVSVKDLKTKETKNYMLERGVSFDKDSLIFIGNHYYTLELDGKNVKVPNANIARYILFKDGKVKFLNQSEYMKLDKAK